MPHRIGPSKGGRNAWEHLRCSGLILESQQVRVCEDKVYVSLSEHAMLQLHVPMMEDCLIGRVERPQPRRVCGRWRRRAARQTVVLVVHRV